MRGPGRAAASSCARSTAEAAPRPVVVALRADRLADLATAYRVQPAGRAGAVPARRHGRGRAARRGRGAGPAGRAARRARLVDLLVREVRATRRAAAAVPRAAGDLEAPRGPHPDRRRVPGDRRHPRRRGPVRRAALRAGRASSSAQLLRDLLLRLVSPGPRASRSAAGSRADWSATDPEHEQLIELLVAARLVTSDDGVLEIAHEALARAWPRLRGWLDDDVEGQRILHHLTGAADAWDALGRPDSELYRGVRLARALEWQRPHATPPSPRSNAQFLEASSRHAEAEQQSTPSEHVRRPG